MSAIEQTYLLTLLPSECFNILHHRFVDYFNYLSRRLIDFKNTFLKTKFNNNDSATSAESKVSAKQHLVGVDLSEIIQYSTMMLELRGFLTSKILYFTF